MLRELSQVHPDRENRRWFSDEDMDLIVWADGTRIKGFQLCYGKRSDERALTWFAEKGFSHERIDDGERTPEKNRSPILVPDGICRVRDVLSDFEARSGAVAPDIRSMVVARLEEFAGHQKGGRIP